jgi:hypothetical protein
MAGCCLVDAQAKGRGGIHDQASAVAGDFYNRLVRGSHVHHGISQPDELCDNRWLNDCEGTWLTA